MKSIEESDGAIHDPIAKPFAVLSGVIAAIIMLPILPFAWLFKKGEDDETTPN